MQNAQNSTKMSRLIPTLLLIFLSALAFAAPKPKTKDVNIAVSKTIKDYSKRQSDSDCVCGVGNRKRIVGGDQAVQNAYPWMVAVYWTTGDLFCGGAVINNQYILSAGHCFKGVEPNMIFVVLGDYDRGAHTDGPATQMNIAQIISHEQFGVKNKVDMDMALLKTSNLIVYSERIQPICLPPPDGNYVGEMGLVAGWGTTSFGGKESNMLLEISVPVLSDSICKSNFTTFYNTNNMICAGYIEGGKDACQGDSGGPLFFPDEHDVYTVAGVISFGRGCATPGYPGVYSKVTYFLNWIEEKTTGSQKCHKPDKNPKPPCGVANTPSRRKRVVGGTNTSPNQYPWTAVIIMKSGRRYELRCGATLISDTWLLTSARCVYGVSIDDLSIVLGDHDISKTEGNEVQRLIKNIAIHPNFVSTRPFTQDIALIEMRSPVTFNDYISPVCLPSSSWTESALVGVEGVVTGWGKNSRGSTIEQEAFMRIISNVNCRRSYGPNLLSNYLCAGGVRGVDICNNDYGGQLSVTSTDKLYRLVGISSFSEKDNCGNGNPAGFTRVTSYLGWIHETSGIVVRE